MCHLAGCVSLDLHTKLDLDHLHKAALVFWASKPIEFLEISALWNRYVLCR